MKTITIKRVLGPAVVLLAAMPPLWALAQSNRAEIRVTEVLSRYERRPVPPADIPNVGPARNSVGPIRNNAFARHSPPLPRTRPVDLTAEVAKEIAPRAGLRAATPPDAAPAVASRPASPTMVPIAPLE